MLVVTCDVDTANASGQKRLRKVAKICERYGMRVLKHELEKIIDTEQDSVRFYRLGNSYERRIETMGKRPRVEAGGALIF